MEPNKSIDGLSTRRAKSGASSSKPTTKRIRKSPQSTLVLNPNPPVKSTKSAKSTRSTTKSTRTNKSATAKPTTSANAAKTAKAAKTSRATKSTKRTKTAKTSKTASNIPDSSELTELFAGSAESSNPTASTTQVASTTQTTLTPTSNTTQANSDPSIAPGSSSNPDSPSNSEEPFATPQTSADDFLKPSQVFDFDENTGELKASESNPNTPHHDSDDESDPHAKESKPKKVKKPVSKKRKIITGIILAIVLLLLASIIWLVIWGNDIIAKITGGQGNIFDLLTFAEPSYQPLKTDQNGRTNVLAFGTSGYNMEGDEGNGVHDGAQLTDSIMVISLNQDTGDVAMLSLPRDLKASPTCTATGKINEVYWCNNMDGTNEQAGAEALMEEVGDILGIDFQYYAHLNWGSLVQIVDTLGGINVTLDEDIEDYYYTGIVFEANKEYTIDGIQAVALARARHGTANGDFSRGASQQKILIGIKDRIQTKELSLTDLIGLANALGDNLRTNFNVEELKTIAHLAADIDFNNARQISLLEPEPLMTTGTINGISYVLPSGGAGYYTRIQNYITKMLSNNPSVYEDASILILNGTETPGRASSEQKSLEDEDYANISIDDAPAGEYTDNYTLYSLNDTKPGTKKALEAKYNLEAKSATDLPAGISQDYDFVIIIGGDSSAKD